MTMSSSMCNVRMHYYTDATAASVPRSTLEVLVTWIWHVTFCGPTGGGKWSQQTQRSIYINTRRSPILKGIEIFTGIPSVVLWLVECGFAANLVRFPEISLDESQSSRQTWTFVTENSNWFYENSENMTFFKILKFSFSEFRKNRFDNFSKSI